MPASALLLIATAAVYLLQFIPAAGPFIYLFGGPLWSILTVNLAMILMAREAWTKRISPAFMLVPILYFGGYYVIFTIEHWNAQKIRQEVIANNASIRIPYVPGQTSFVGQSRQSAMGLLRQNYAIDQVFAPDSNQGRQMHVWRIIDRSFCGPSGGRGHTLYPLLPGGRERCVVDRPQEPTGDRLVATSTFARTDTWLVNAEYVSLTVRDPHGRSYILRGASVWTRPFIPMPLITFFDNKRWPLTFPRLIYRPVGAHVGTWKFYDPFRGGEAGQRAGQMTYEALAIALGLPPLPSQ